MKIRKNDMVKVISGREKGKTGRVIEVDTKNERVLVERVNFVKRHQKPSQRYRQGGIIEKEAPIHVSNVMFYEEKTGKATRVGSKDVDGKKVRVSKRSGEVIVAAAAK
ncbi:MAG TPA: 50S ribosomal protein L24 [bacterium]|mgnify:CR=1 FL=1|nr:50S ribosomal protein L24 [bacterium]